MPTKKTVALTHSHETDTVKRSKRPRNPVIDVYNEYRTTRLNVKYYSLQLKKLVTTNLVIQIVLVISTSSTFAGSLFFRSGHGTVAWKWFGLVAAFLATYQLVCRLPEKVGQLEARVTAYQAIEFDIAWLSRQIAKTGRYEQALRNQFEAIMARKNALVLSYVDPAIRQRLRQRCYNEVLEELPLESFFLPEEEH